MREQMLILQRIPIMEEYMRERNGDITMDS